MCSVENLLLPLKFLHVDLSHCCHADFAVHSYAYYTDGDYSSNTNFIIDNIIIHRISFATIVCGCRRRVAADQWWAANGAGSCFRQRTAGLQRGYGAWSTSPGRPRRHQGAQGPTRPPRRREGPHRRRPATRPRLSWSRGPNPRGSEPTVQCPARGSGSSRDIGSRVERKAGTYKSGAEGREAGDAGCGSGRLL